ncbi:MAG: hypothetical protein NW214_14205 [Pseudanabaenaceae cyanobacterium bins.39]|nr:hypothetical protein [Pseudanabaenaceae cyanobacterium bins.39]
MSNNVSANSAVSPEVVYEKLDQLDLFDLTTSAEYRELAQDILADRGVDCDMREAIADRLNQANHQLINNTVSKTDSY